LSKRDIKLIDTGLDFGKLLCFRGVFSTIKVLDF
jgi:hypothetical protein